MARSWDSSARFGRRLGNRRRDCQRDLCGDQAAPAQEAGRCQPAEAGVSTFFMEGFRDDSRTAYLSGRSGPNGIAAGSVQGPASPDLGKTRYPCDRLLDDPGRGIQQPADLHAAVGVAGRSRDEVDGVPERPGLAQGARRGRTGRTDRCKHQQSNPDADCLLGAEIDRRFRKSATLPARQQSSTGISHVFAKRASMIAALS